MHAIVGIACMHEFPLAPHGKTKMAFFSRFTKGFSSQRDVDFQNQTQIKFIQLLEY